MPLSFKCHKCKNEIISGYLNRGETMACPFCGVIIVIPDTAKETSKPATIKSKVPSIKSSFGKKWELKITEKDDIPPVCPYCEIELTEFYIRSKGWGFINTKDSVYFCPNYHKVLGFGQSRMM